MQKKIMEKYNPQKIEKKWQEYWETNNYYRVEDFSKKPKIYILVEFPYPSGSGLHVGHVRGYSVLDVIARKKRLQGFNVLYPIGWDAFGLPTENYAIKTKTHPKEVTQKNITNFKKQIKSIGLSFDWSREINTTDSKYYKWTQWIFLQLFKKGLAYQAEIPINWCPRCKTGLANEEVISGKCERCGTQVKRKVLKQWMLKITAYADRLIDDLKIVNYSQKIKTQQINWIGKSIGTEIIFSIANFPDKIKVFTTRIDTIFGVTAIVLAPENKIVQKLKEKALNLKEIEKYIEKTREKSEFERTELKKIKTGVELKGIKAINPATNKEIPVWIGDYVLSFYGGGAVMMVPAHDYRDYDFAKKYKIEIREVISGGDISKKAFVDYGKLINSGKFNGLQSKEAIKEIKEWLGFTKNIVHYKLRDWIFSRQHYWGEPIPIIHCQKCGFVPEENLPLELPYIKNYQPTDTCESPLSELSEWVNIKCPKCNGPAKRETDTMPNWAGSNWYFMRYTDPNNDKHLADQKKLKYWMPVDWYNGGMEHTTLHLLYSRFIYKFLYDIGVSPESEPYKKRTSHGVVLAQDGRKMSKSLDNVINPDDIIKKYGADSLRVYEMFMGPFDQAIVWNEKGVKGVSRFLEKIWKLVLESKEKQSSKRMIKSMTNLNEKVTEDIESAKLNTSIAAFMKFSNLWANNKEEVGQDIIEQFLIILSPFAPHLTQELWEKIKGKKNLEKQEWPKFNKILDEEERILLIIQINGKTRDKIEVEFNLLKEKALDLTLKQEKIKKWTEGKEIKKVIFIQNKLINIVCAE